MALNKGKEEMNGVNKTTTKLKDDLPGSTQKTVKQESFPVIGMGGSAGSFGAFEKFFMNMPSDSGMAFIVVIHMDPSRNMNISSLLQPFTAMEIVEAADGMLVEPNKVYVIPPNKDMGIHNRHLLLFEVSRSKGAHMAIDHFLQSLAEDQWNHGVAIIFSGMGADGETGVRMIKEKLGMAMVQSPETASFKSMPQAAIKSNMVDYVLSPEDMPLKLQQYLNHPALREPAADEFISEKNNQTNVRKILMILRSQIGHDFSLYKKNTITRRIERRIAFHQLPDYEQYVTYLRENPQEVQVLFNELLIGVTKFFRDHAAFESLQPKLISLVKKKQKDDPIRIWIAGCSTGEEAYSVAIMVMEYIDELKSSKTPKVQIFATDLDANAIEQARAGFYFSNISSEVSPERLERFFVKKNNGYVVKKEIREMIVFAQHNLIKDAPFTKLDLLCCRNVMIYLTADLQSKIIPVFNYSLHINGLLFLGPAESVGNYNDLFNNLDSKWKIYERKDGASALGTSLDFPFHITNPVNKGNKIESPIKHTAKNVVADTFHKLLLENYTPTSLLLNDKGEILYINGNASKYLHLNSGEAAMNIHRMAREEIKYAVGNAMHQALVHKNKIEVNEARIKENNRVHKVSFTIEYLVEYPLNDLLLVSFEDKGPIKRVRSKSGKHDPIREGAVEELEKELIYTKQQLHSTIEQMETSLEELKSTNEELQSTNEELQSTNEEALTTKEEMQSLNEELMTINLQYQNKAQELSQLNNDMKNLLDNTEIGTIFLDNQLNILRFTPQVTKLFNVISSDIGRSITHIVSNFDYPSIENTINEVIEKLSGKELEVKTKKGEWYNMRIMPYRTMDNFISGAVLTFTKITPFKSLENKLQSLLKYLNIEIEKEPDPCLIVDHNKIVLVANDKFLKLFALRNYEVLEHSLLEIVNNTWHVEKLNEVLLKESARTQEFFLQHNFSGIGIKNLYIKIERIRENDTTPATALKITFKEQ